MIYILKGDIETGKSEALLHWASQRNDVYGVISPRNKDQQRYFLDVKNMVSFSMQANFEEENTVSVGRYIFYRSAFNTANKIILNTVNNINEGYIIIDELGKLELQSDGLHASAQKAINVAIRHPNLHCILVIRTELLEAILNNYNISDYKIITKQQFVIDYGANAHYKTQINFNQ